MSNALERMRKNKNVRPEGEVEDLLVLKEEIKTVNNSKNNNGNIPGNEIENTSVNNSENNYIVESNNILKNENVTAYISANKKPKFEELHKQDTFWVKIELLGKLRGITKGHKGLKTRIINESLEMFFKKNKM